MLSGQADHVEKQLVHGALKQQHQTSPIISRWASLIGTSRYVVPSALNRHRPTAKEYRILAQPSWICRDRFYCPASKRRCRDMPDMDSQTMHPRADVFAAKRGGFYGARPQWASASCSRNRYANGSGEATVCSHRGDVLVNASQQRLELSARWRR